MKKSVLGIALFSLLLVSCGGNSDVKTFCECVANPTDECEAEMEKLEGEFKKDEERYKKFAEEARKECPDAEKYIKRMN